MKLRRCAAAAVVLTLAVTSPVLAQARLPRRAPAPQADGVSPGEIQKLFDAYVIMQAQQELQLTDEQYPKFLGRVKALQEVRQRGQGDRARIIQEFRRLNDSATLDDARAKAQLKLLAETDARIATEVRDALAGIDQVLDLRQQLRFRIFEEQMERRKVDLLMRARQANRARNQP